MSDQPAPPYGSPEHLRAVIAEAYWLLGCQCEIALRNANIGDDAAVVYSTRKALAYMRFIAATVRDLRDPDEPEPPEKPRQWTTDEPEFGRATSEPRPDSEAHT
jgi:hypothetical protein